MEIMKSGVSGAKSPRYPKHGGGSVMVWVCIAASGVGNLVFMDSTIKKEEFLANFTD